MFKWIIKLIPKFIKTWFINLLYDDIASKGINGEYINRPYYYNLFDTWFDPVNKSYMGEDFAFCKRWKNIGGKLYCYIMDYITHVGEFQYTGRLYDEMTKQVVEKPPQSE